MSSLHSAPLPVAPGSFPVVDERELNEERYAIIELTPEGDRRRIAFAEDAGGLGLGLVTLREEGQITGEMNIGVLDNLSRLWVVSPYARRPK